MLQHKIRSTERLISIIMINRNGGDYLRRALRSLRGSLEESNHAPVDYELLLVDNGSTDDSVAIVESELESVLFPWRIVEEIEPGVNSARLAGLNAASGQYLIFTDNDLKFSTEWLDGYRRAIKEYPHERIFAGRVKVGEVEGEVPRWLDLTGEYSRPSIVVRCDNGETTFQTELDANGVDGPVGPNMAFERSVFQDYGVFDTNFGLRPGSLVAGAEAEYFHRLSRQGESFVYVAEACVLHPLKRNQISKAYFRNRLCGIGRVLSRLQHINGLSTPRVFGVKRYLFRQLLEAWGDYLRTWFQSCPRKRFYYRCNVSIVWGQIQEDFAQRAASIETPSLKISKFAESAK
ncbi:MAG: glycosyltransferase family 2 protein [Planctomycetaceae bacterium]|nr:glycosyltransferase family 2 protein [Planctomycetaceae bacterium]